MNEKSSNTRNVRRLQRAPQRIAQQRGSEPRLMVFLVNRQTARHHHRNRVGPVAAQCSQRFGMPQRTRRKGLRCRNHLPASHGAGAFSNLRSRSLGGGGLSSIA